MSDTLVGGREEPFDGVVGRAPCFVTDSHLGENSWQPALQQGFGSATRNLVWVSGDLAYEPRRSPLIGQTILTPGQAVQETSFAYAGNQIVLQFDGTSTANTTGPASPLTVADLSHRYLSGPAVDQILAGEQVSNLTQPGNVLFSLTNNEGTVCDLGNATRRPARRAS